MVIFVAFAMKFPVYAMGAGICSLGLFPFTWGLQTGMSYTLFADESVLILYLLAFPFLYLVTNRVWQPGFMNLYIALGVLVCTLGVSLAAAPDIFAVRTFLSTFGIGVLLLVLFLQEGSNSNPEETGEFVVWIIVLVAALSLIERVVQRNPFVEHTPLYMSAEFVRINHGAYRPYVSFFHPSETGAVMAVGNPFVLRAWPRRRSLLSLLCVGIVAAAILVNATRGVWVGLFVAALVAVSGVRNARKWLSMLLALAIAAGTSGYLMLRNAPFFQRLSDPTDLYERLHTWVVAAQLLLAHPLFGIGSFNLVKAYVEFTGDSKGGFTADNMFVSTLAETGLLGFVSFVTILALSLALLRRYRKDLAAYGLSVESSFVRCTELALICYIFTGCFADTQSFRKLAKFIFILIGLGLAQGAYVLRSTETRPKAWSGICKRALT